MQIETPSKTSKGNRGLIAKHLTSLLFGLKYNSLPMSLSNTCCIVFHVKTNNNSNEIVNVKYGFLSLFIGELFGVLKSRNYYNYCNVSGADFTQDKQDV